VKNRACSIASGSVGRQLAGARVPIKITLITSTMGTKQHVCPHLRAQHGTA
jgi:hypothetical protein